MSTQAAWLVFLCSDCVQPPVHLKFVPLHLKVQLHPIPNVIDLLMPLHSCVSISFSHIVLSAKWYVEMAGLQFPNV